MRLTIKQLYELSKSSGMSVLGHDGLPFNTVTTISPDPNTFYFRHEEDEKNWDCFDVIEFYEKCIPSICQNDFVAGECLIHHIGNISYIGVDLYIDVPEEGYGVTTLNSKLVKLELDASKDPLDLDLNKYAEWARKMGLIPVDF